jgi:hypothetical protein
MSHAPVDIPYIHADLTAAIASTYGYQRLSNQLASGVMQTMYQRPPFDDAFRK